MSSKYRIVQQPDGKVNIQKHVKCLYCFSSWQYLGRNIYAGMDNPQQFVATDYLTMEIAKQTIDNLLKEEHQCSQPPIITPYPAPSLASPA